MIRDFKVYAIKIWNFETTNEGEHSSHVYRGKAPGNIRLGDLVSDFLTVTDLEFDDAEEWYYTDQNYGGLEVTGCCVPLEDEPNQVIMQLTVISQSEFKAT